MNDNERRQTIEDYEKTKKQRDELLNLVVKDNKIIQKSRYSLTITQQKFLCYLISKIKPTDTELTFEIKAQDFCELIGIKTQWFYDEFKNLIDDFDNKSFWVEEANQIYKFRWLSDSRYLKGKATIQITLAQTLKDYLLGLSENFTQYELYNIIALRSKYAIRLFELIKSYSYQHEKEFDIDILKELLDAVNYKKFADLKRRVIEPSIREINTYTELNIDYVTIASGRTIIAIRFIITKKEKMESYTSYLKTIEEINKRNNIIKGQLAFNKKGEIYEE